MTGRPRSTTAGPRLTARPGRDRRTSRCAAIPGAEAVRVEVWHPEGWLVDGWEWPWPGARARAAGGGAGASRGAARSTSREPGSARASPADGRHWLRDWPQLHVLDVDMPHVPVPLPRTDGGHVVVARARTRSARRSRAGTGRDRSPPGSRAGPSSFEYECTYLGIARVQRQGGRPDPASVARADRPLVAPHRRVEPLPGGSRRANVGLRRRGAGRRTRPSIRRRPGSRTRPRRAATTIGARSGAILVAGATDGRAVADGAVRRDAARPSRAVDGSPELHVLDWYGGVRTLDGNHPIWSAYLGSGLPVTTGTTLRGRIVLAAGDRP